MQIKMLASRFAAGGALSYVAGTTYEVANDLALQFIGDNAAVEVNGSRAAATDCLRDEFSKPEGIAGIALVSGAGNLQYITKVVTFGDSFSMNSVYSSGTDPFGVSPPPWFPDVANDNFVRSWGWPAWLGPLSMQRIQWAKNYGVQTNGLLYAGTTPPGNQLSVQVTRYLSEAGAIKANRAAILIGANDTAFTVQECVTELLTQIRRLNMPVDILSTPPRAGAANTTVVGDGMQMWAWLQNWRAALRRIAHESKGGIKFIDAYSLGNTPGTVPDVLAAGSTYDNIHSNNAYAFRIADAYVQSLLPSTLAGDIDLWPNNSNASSAGSNNLLDQGVINPILATASGGTNFGAGTVAGNYTLAAVAGGTLSAGASVIANPNGLGNMQRIPIASASAGDGVTFTSDTFHAAGGTFFSAGDEFYGQCLVTVNVGGILPRNIRLNLQINNGGTAINRMLFEISPTNEIALPITVTRSFLLRTPKLIVPSGYAPIAATLAVRPTFAGAGNCTIDIGNMECRRIRAGGVYA